MYYINANELYHHGIKGQRWGVRRYQNADGTLTALGRRRELSRTDDSSKQKRKSNIKKAIIIGASVAAVGLAVYGGYKLNNKVTESLVQSYANAGQTFINRGSNFLKRSVEFYGIADNVMKKHGNYETAMKLAKMGEEYDRRSSAYYKEAANITNKIAGKGSHFDKKERLDAAKRILKDGEEIFRNRKEEEIVTNLALSILNKRH